MKYPFVRSGTPSPHYVRVGQQGHPSHTSQRGTDPSYQSTFLQRGIGVFDFDEAKLDFALGELIYEVDKLSLCDPVSSRLVVLFDGRCWRTACSENLENAFFSRIVLESAHQRSLDRIDNPLSVGWRAASGTRGSRSIDDRLIAAGDGRTLGRGVEGSHTLELVKQNESSHKGRSVLGVARDKDCVKPLRGRWRH